MLIKKINIILGSVVVLMAPLVLWIDLTKGLYFSALFKLLTGVFITNLVVQDIKFLKCSKK